MSLKKLKEIMINILKFIDEKFEEIIGAAILAVVVSLIFAGVVLRLLFTTGLAWQEELSRYLFVLVVYLGASYGIKSQDHIRITFVVGALPKSAQKVVHVITDIVWMGFNIFIVIASFNVYQHMKGFLGESGILKIPLHYIFLTIPVGFVLLTLRLIQGYIRKLTGSRTNTETGPAETER